MRTAICSWSWGLRLKSAEPQFEQNAFSKPSSGAVEGDQVGPLVTWNEPVAGRALIAAAVPVRRWHLVQWQ